MSKSRGGSGDPHCPFLGRPCHNCSKYNINIITRITSPHPTPFRKPLSSACFPFSFFIHFPGGHSPHSPLCADVHAADRSYLGLYLWPPLTASWPPAPHSAPLGRDTTNISSSVLPTEKLQCPDCRLALTEWLRSADATQYWRVMRTNAEPQNMSRRQTERHAVKLLITRLSQVRCISNTK